MMEVEELGLGVRLFRPRVFRDARGAFLETWQKARYLGAALPGAFVQDNVSISGARVLRGLHFQFPGPQGKLVTVLQGAVFDVAVDVRVGSPTFGQWVGAELNGDTLAQLYLPEGLAHGFLVLGDQAVLHYKCSTYYDPGNESVVSWRDPDLAIAWPVADPVLSPKDSAAPRLRDIPPERLPRWGGILAPGAPSDSW